MSQQYQYRVRESQALTVTGVDIVVEELQELN